MRRCRANPATRTARGGGKAVAAILLALVLIPGLCSPELCRPAWALPAIERIEAAGIEAWLVEDHAVPVISLAFAFRGGSALDPPGKEGLATLATSLLGEGAGAIDALTFARELDDRAIHLSFESGREEISGALQTLREERERAFYLLHLALSRPRFEADTVARVRAQLVATIREARGDPAVVAEERLFAILFAEHPYGRPIDGTSASLARITRADLQRFANSELTRTRLIIGLAGDLTASEAKSLIETAFAALPAGSAPPPETRAEARTAVTGGVTVVPMDVPQSAIAFGQEGPKRDDPDFYVATVLNQIIGGDGPASTLFAELRERRGLVYGVSTSLETLPRAGLWIGAAATANARAGETVRLIRETWQDVARNGVSASDVADAKTYLIGSYPLNYTSTALIADLLVSQQRDQLGADYAEHRAALLNAVSVDDVNRLARSLLRADRLTFVVTGKPLGLNETTVEKR